MHHARSRTHVEIPQVESLVQRTQHVLVATLQRDGDSRAVFDATCVVDEARQPRRQRFVRPLIAVEEIRSGLNESFPNSVSRFVPIVANFSLFQRMTRIARNDGKT